MSEPSRLNEADGDSSRNQEGAVDRALVARWLGGDERAATLLVERHAPALARFAASLIGSRGTKGGSGAEVDDLVQDTFVRAFQSLADFRGESSLRTWLFTIERRLLVERRRSERRRPDREDIGEADAATEYTALDAMVADETEGRIRRSLERLSPMQREIFTLRVAEGLSYKEIADVVGSTEGAARVHYHNAVRVIKEHVDA